MSLSEMVARIAALPPETRAEVINAFPGGLDGTLGLAFTWCDAERVEATLTATDAHTQVYGLVHGGVYCAMVEAVGPCGSAMLHLPEGRFTVGVENRTQFLRASRAGSVLTAMGVPEEVTENGSLWRVRIVDQDGVLCAKGELETRALRPGHEVAGQALRLPDEGDEDSGSGGA